MSPSMRFQVYTHEVTLTDADLVYETEFAPGTLQRDWAPECGRWRETSQGLEGSIPEERAAACWHRQSFPGDVALCFVASTCAPHRRDINCLWSGRGKLHGTGPRDCYVGGLGGWWAHKHGLERHPEGGWLALGRGCELRPEQRYRVLAGRLGGWQFLHVDGQFVVEAFDADALDSACCDRVGLATWASQVVFHEFQIYRVRQVRLGRRLVPGGEY